MKTVLYARSSIKSQEHSIDMQKALALEKAKANGLLFDDLYLDEAVSARKTEIHERPQLNRLVQDIKNGSVFTVYVYKRDRLARNVSQYMELFELIRSKNITVVFTAANEIPMQFSPAGEFFELMMAGFNQREANQIVQRIKETKYTMTRQGKHAQGRIAYGYVLDKDKKYKLDPTQALVIRKIYDAVIDTECTNFSDFVRELQTTDWFPKKWDYNRVLLLLNNSIYKGIRMIEEFGEFIEIINENLIIVDELTWDKAQEKLQSLRKQRSRNSNRVPMMLDGLLFCGKCSNPMLGKETTDLWTRSFYTCKNHNYLKYSPELIEDTILEESAKYISLQFQTHFSEVYKLTHGNMIQYYKNSISESENALRMFKQKLVENTSLWLKDPAEELQNELIYLLNCIHRAELLLKRYPDDLIHLEQQFQLMNRLQNSVDLFSEISSYSPEDKEQLIRDLVGRIVLNASSLSIELKDPFVGKAVIGHITAS